MNLSAATLYDLLNHWATVIPTTPALLAPAQPLLTFADLPAQLDALRATLNGWGIGRGDRVAVLAPPGADTALVILGVLSGAVAVPLNPQATAAECATLLAAVQARALLAPAGLDAAAVAVAAQQGLPLWRWHCAAGQVQLSGGQAAVAAQPGPAQPEDMALLLLTSGTTAESKRVPVTQRQLVARAHKTGSLFGLRPGDRCLNLMPLCYAHGLNSGLIGPLGAGGGVICAPAFTAAVFLDCLHRLAPSWYTAGATHQQAILGWLPTEPFTHSLRFIRSGAAALPGWVREQLEQRFGVPVIEAYSSTETGTITANPPHGLRKPGTVGITLDDDVLIVDTHGQPLPPGQTGEVLVRGPIVVAGYDNNPELTRQAFRDGCYHTGDAGWLDADGYLTLTGRLKDLINRGGEKVAPREVEAALLAQPAVAQALVFPVPHPTLGEEVAAAVVLRAGQNATEWALRQCLYQRLTPFKVPRRIVITAELPVGPTGKPLRQGLAERFGLLAGNAAEADISGYTPLEQQLTALWREVLARDGLGREADFFLAGGDSLSALRLLARLQQTLALDLPLLSLLELPTPRQMAAAIQQSRLGSRQDTVGVHTDGGERPLFGVCGRYGYALRLLLVGRELGPQQPVYGLQPPGMDWAAAGCVTLPDMAAHYGERIRAIQPQGPYRLFGTSFGGVVMFELALQLQAAGEAVEFLALVDSAPPPLCGEEQAESIRLPAVADALLPENEIEAAGIRVARAHVQSRVGYCLERRFHGELTYFYCTGHPSVPGQDRRRLWQRVAERVRLLPLPGLHGLFHQEPQFSALVHSLRDCLHGTPPPGCDPAQVFGEATPAPADPATPAPAG